MAFQDIRKQVRQSLTPADMVFLLGALVILSALFALNLYLARTYQGGEWLFLRWSAARAFVFFEIEPYGATVAQGVQNIVYGREAFLNEYPFALNDPFYITLFYVPLVWVFSDFTVVHALWMLLSQAALVAIVVLAVRLAELEPPGWLLAALIVFTLLNYFSIQAIQASSPAIFLILLYLIILTFLQERADELAGGLLVLTAYQWEIGALFFFFVVVLVIAHRRWGVFSGMVMTLVALIGVSLIAKSNWILLFAQAVVYNWNQSIDYTFAVTLAYIFPGMTVPPSKWLALIFGALFFAETLTAVNASFRHIVWVAMLALTLNPLLGFALFPASHVAYVPALAIIVLLVRERWIKRPWISALSLILIWLLSYSFYYLSLDAPERFFTDLMKVLSPIFTLTLLYWMRWWAVRPPRIWADQFGVPR